MSAPAPKPRTRPTRRRFQFRATPATAPMSSEDAATRPQVSAESTARSIRQCGAGKLGRGEKGAVVRYATKREIARPIGAIDEV